MAGEIKKGSIVKISFEAYCEGKLFDKKDEKKPLEFKCGVDKINSYFEKSLEGKKKGDSYELKIKSFETPEFSLPIELLFEEIPEDLKKGNLLDMDYGGKTNTVEVVGFNDYEIRLKLYNPIEGKDVLFKIKVLDIT